MPSFLSKSWVDELVAALGASSEVGASLRDAELTLQQVVTDAPDGEVAFWTTFDNGSVSGDLGRAAEPDVSFSMDYATATSLARAELNYQAAFMQGLLKITGNMGKLLQHQDTLKILGPTMATIGTE